MTEIINKNRLNQKDNNPKARVPQNLKTNWNQYKISLSKYPKKSTLSRTKWLVNSVKSRINDLLRRISLICTISTPVLC